MRMEKGMDRYGRPSCHLGYNESGSPSVFFCCVVFCLWFFVFVFCCEDQYSTCLVFFEFVVLRVMIVLIHDQSASAA